MRGCGKYWHETWHAANLPYRLPPPLFHARGRALWISLGLVALVSLSFWSLDLRWYYLPLRGREKHGALVGEFFPPDLSPKFVSKVVVASMETLAMSGLGTCCTLFFATGGLPQAAPIR